MLRCGVARVVGCGIGVHGTAGVRCVRGCEIGCGLARDVTSLGLVRQQRKINNARLQCGHA